MFYFFFFSWFFLSEIIPSLHHQLFFYYLLFDHSHTVCELTMKNQLNQFFDNLSISILNMFSSEVKNEHMYASSFWTCCPRSPLNQKSDVNNNIHREISFIKKNISKIYSLTAERKAQQNEMTFLNTFLKLISKKFSIWYLSLQSDKKLLCYMTPCGLDLVFSKESKMHNGLKNVEQFSNQPTQYTKSN